MPRTYTSIHIDGDEDLTVTADLHHGTGGGYVDLDVVVIHHSDLAKLADLLGEMHDAVLGLMVHEARPGGGAA